MRIYITIIALVIAGMVAGALLALMAKQAYGAGVSASVKTNPCNICLSKCK